MLLSFPLIRGKLHIESIKLACLNEGQANNADFH